MVKVEVEVLKQLERKFRSSWEYAVSLKEKDRGLFVRALNSAIRELEKNLSLFGVEVELPRAEKGTTEEFLRLWRDIHSKVWGKPDKGEKR